MLFKRSLLTLTLVCVALSLAGGPALAAGTPLAPVGPSQFPEGVSPLTGLAVDDPALLKLPPALVSVTNFPVSARPQAGLSAAANVYELYIGMGMTRYLAVYYGQFPQAASANNEQVKIGPIRSGRLPYESLRKLFNGSLVMAGASAEVGAQLNASTTIYGTDKSSINSALIDVTRLRSIAEANGKALTSPLNLTGNQFNLVAPAGGQPAKSTQIFYNFYNQIRWTYDPAIGAYLRSQDKADGSGKFYPTTDRLTGENLAFQNVVVLFAHHTAIKPTIIDVNLLYTTGPALLFRDGQVYRIHWNTINGDYEKSSRRLRPMRFVDDAGQPFSLKPGQTWVEVVTDTTTAQEKNPGEWRVRFYAP